VCLVCLSAHNSGMGRAIAFKFSGYLRAIEDGFPHKKFGGRG